MKCAWPIVFRGVRKKKIRDNNSPSQRRWDCVQHTIYLLLDTKACVQICPFIHSSSGGLQFFQVIIHIN